MASGIAERVWHLMEKIGFAMLVTLDGDKLRAHPMSACVRPSETSICFLTDARRHKDEEIARHPGVNISFADTSSENYVSLTGTAAISNDRCRIKDLFSTPAKPWWDSPHDPNIRLLRITLDNAEFWHSPRQGYLLVKTAAAAAAASRPGISGNRKVEM